MTRSRITLVITKVLKKRRTNEQAVRFLTICHYVMPRFNFVRDFCYLMMLQAVGGLLVVLLLLDMQILLYANVASFYSLVQWNVDDIFFSVSSLSFLPLSFIHSFYSGGLMYKSKIYFCLCFHHMLFLSHNASFLIQAER